MTISFELDDLLEEFIQDVQEKNDPSSGTPPIENTPDRYTNLKKKFDGDFEAMMNRFGKEYHQLSSLVVARKAVSDEASKRLSQAKGWLSRLKNTMDWCMESEFSDKKKDQKLKLSNANISYSKSIGLLIEDESLIPNHFTKKETVVSILNAEVKEALKEWVVVEGAKLDVRQNIQIK